MIDVSAASVAHDLFVPDVSLLEKTLRALLVFVFLVAALRLGGKRELGQINVLDLAVLLLVSNALQNAMIGADNSLIGGVVGATTLFVANYLFVRLVLTGGVVADPYRRRALVARQPVEHQLCQPPLSGSSVHDLHLPWRAGD